MSTRSLVSPEVSRRFDVLRTVLVLFVVGIHAEKIIDAYYSQTPDLLRACLVLFPHNIYRLCVPIFFGISGYLFYKTFAPTAAAYGRMLVKKSRTILLPYLLFNALTLGLIFLFHKVPYMGDVNFIRQRGFFELLFGLYGYPVVYPLWFLRDLYVYFLLAPVFYAVSQEIPLVGLIVFWALWLFVPQAGLPVEFSGAFFFYGGCLLSRKNVVLEQAGRLLTPALCIYLALLLTVAHVEYHYGFTPLYHFLYRNSMIAGVVVFWCLSAYPWFRDNRLLLGLSAGSFFVYLTHEPVLSYLIYVTRFVAKPSGSLAGIAAMLVLTILVFAVCAGLGRFLERFAPRLYALVTGSR